MKIKVLILFFSVTGILTLYRCKCYPCLADGESFDLPYSSGQVVSFVNDLLERIDFTVLMQNSLPPDQFCGSLGSSSYGWCDGLSSAALKNDSSVFIRVNATTPTTDLAELKVGYMISIANGTLYISEAKVSTLDNHATALTEDNIEINGIKYNQVYVYQNDSATLNDCSYFVYSKQKGVLKFTIRHDLASET